jgi:hypothetical protein
VFLRGGVVVSWASKKQATLIFLYIKIEYMASTQANKRALWLRRFIGKVGYKF